MHLPLSDDQRLFTHTTRRFLTDTADIAAVRALASDPDGFDCSWWARGAELGWTTLLAPARFGGGGVSDAAVSDLAELAFERGRAVAPGPFASVNAAVAALAHGSPTVDDLVEDVLAGVALAVLAAEERGVRWPGRRSATTADRSGDDVVVNGTKILVESAPAARAFIVLAATENGPALVVVGSDDAGVTIVPRHSVDLVRRFAEVTFSDVRVPADAVLVDDLAQVERCLDIATVLQLAETVGALDRVLEFTREWAFDRYTFGRPLASYQELKHRFADMTLWLEASKATVVEAARALSAGDADAAELVSTAAAYVDDRGPELVQDCVQMHGGIGVTWEHDLHVYLRRVTINSLTFGTVADHRERLAALILEGAAR